METPKYYTVPELAALWGCTQHLVYTLLNRGTLEGFKLGVSWRIPDAARQACEKRLAEESKPAKRAPIYKIK